MRHFEIKSKHFDWSRFNILICLKICNQISTFWLFTTHLLVHFDVWHLEKGFEYFQIVLLHTNYDIWSFILFHSNLQNLVSKVLQFGWKKLRHFEIKFKHFDWSNFHYSLNILINIKFVTKSQHFDCFLHLYLYILIELFISKFYLTIYILIVSCIYTYI